MVLTLSEKIKTDDITFFVIIIPISLKGTIEESETNRATRNGPLQSNPAHAEKYGRKLVK